MPQSSPFQADSKDKLQALLNKTMANQKPGQYTVSATKASSLPNLYTSKFEPDFQLFKCGEDPQFGLLARYFVRA